MDKDFPMEVFFEEDGSMTIEWDNNHPVTSIFNDWKKEDFIKMIAKAAKETIEKYGN